MLKLTIQNITCFGPFIVCNWKVESFTWSERNTLMSGSEV